MRQPITFPNEPSIPITISTIASTNMMPHDTRSLNQTPPILSQGSVPSPTCVVWAM